MNAVMKPIGRTRATTSGLTEAAAEFVKHYCSGVSQTKAAQMAGYSNPGTEAWRLLRTPSVVAAINREAERQLATEGVQRATAFMIRAVDDKALSGAVRIQAAKWVLENAGHGLAAQRAALGLPVNDKPLSEMSINELDAFLHAGLNALEHVKAQEQRTIEGSARNAEPDGDGVVAQAIEGQVVSG